MARMSGGSCPVQVFAFSLHASEIQRHHHVRFETSMWHTYLRLALPWPLRGALFSFCLLTTIDHSQGNHSCRLCQSWKMESHKCTLLAVSIIFFSLSTTFVGLYLCTCLFVVKRLRLADYLMFLAWVKRATRKSKEVSTPLIIIKTDMWSWPGSVSLLCNW